MFLLDWLAVYKRILLKLSGEQLSGKYESGIDPEKAAWLADEVKKVAANGSQVVIMVGGGNFLRGAQIAGHGIKRVTADHMGMLGTMMNSLALTDIFEAHDVKTRCLSTIFAHQVAEPFVHRLAEKHLAKGRVVIVGGGSGRPFVTTDTAALILALELSCDVVLKTTKVDGVYDKDPHKHDDAIRYEELTYRQAVADGAIQVMDKSALGLAMDQNMPLVIFSAEQSGDIASAARGERVGTLVR